MESNQIRNNKRYNKAFYFALEGQLLDEIKKLAQEEHMSISAFIRQSAARNVAFTRHQKQTEHV
jgi:hypothetical protein